ncbi:hypothetical protein F5Y04DRAFT_245230 [Hypomontagnella monticulosa]|nr:hypothetical protein F5Y04DRAFT_245230 [Hypomontagnella monticulosa]
MTPTSSNFTGDLAYQYWQDHGDDGKGKEPMKSTESPRGAEASREPSTGESSPETATLPNESPKSDTQSPYSGGVFPSSLDDDDDTLVPKYMLPQNDPAYFELLTRDHSDLVRRSEANAIWCQQEAKSIPKEEMRARYSAFFPVREQMAAWKSGYEYDPNAPGMPEAEQDSGVVIKQETPDTDAQK